MLNYVKSEIYRITHSWGIYVLALCFGAVPLFFNLMLYGFERFTPDFPYATTSFSYSNIVANPMIFCLAALCLVFVLYEGNKKNGNLKNVVAFGISREKIFVGEFMVCLIASVFVLVITATVYILSASLLLKKEGAVEVTDFINEILSVSPVAVFALLLAIFAVLLFEKSFTGFIFWYGILFLIPQILFYMGFKVKPIQEIAMWMPRNFFGTMEVNQQVCAPIWDTAKGLATCFISGIAGMAVFGILGVTVLRKKEF